MSNTFFTSDTHFGHANILKYDQKTRGHFCSIEEHDEHIIEQWNFIVKPKDTVYHLGDFSFKSDHNAYVKRLNGDIHLIWGNHDKHGMYKDFATCQDVLMLKGLKLFLSHYPHYEWPSAYHGVAHLFGHVHEAFTHVPGVTFPNLNVAINLHNFLPIHFDELQEKYNK